MYTDLINRHISDPEQHLKVFDKNSVYLADQENRQEQSQSRRNRSRQCRKAGMEQDSGYGVIIGYFRSKDFRSQADRDTRKSEPVYQKQGLAA